MPFDSERFPKLIHELYRVVGELEAMFPGRPFTPDGHMVGSLAECFAEHYYDLKLFACSYPGHDAYTSDCKVEIKATQGNSVALRSGPDMLLVFKLLRDGSFEEIYNGPGAPVWALADSTWKCNTATITQRSGKLVCVFCHPACLQQLCL